MAEHAGGHGESTLTHGVRANRGQLALLTLVVLFVGGMVGMERAVVPLMGVRLFGLTSASAALSFIVTFGVTKGVVNLFVGRLADLWGRRRLLLLGWAFGLPIPFLLMLAPSWNGILLANVLLGLTQSLAWSMTVVMALDLAGPRARGLVVGLNEFAGYAGVALVALATGYIAQHTALRPQPFYLGAGAAALGLFLSLFTRDTGAHVRREAGAQADRTQPSFARVFLDATFRQPSLSAASLGGLATNLKDGMIWGLLPLFLGARHLGLALLGVVVAVYPAVWALGQLVFGPLSDRVGRKGLIVGGLALQAAAIVLFIVLHALAGWLAAAFALGLGTAMVYPTLIALVSDVAAPSWRAAALGVYRSWRDLGYAVGALTSGLLADAFGIPAAMALIAVLLAAVAVQAGLRIRAVPGAGSDAGPPPGAIGGGDGG